MKHDPTKPSLVILPSEYDDAIMGMSINPTEQPRFAYSLTRLVEIHQTKTMTVHTDAVREEVWAMVKDIHTKTGLRSPLFIDDSNAVPKIIAPKAAPTKLAVPKIITPNGFRN